MGYSRSPKYQCPHTPKHEGCLCTTCCPPQECFGINTSALQLLNTLKAENLRLRQGMSLRQQEEEESRLNNISYTTCETCVDKVICEQHRDYVNKRK